MREENLKEVLTGLQQIYQTSSPVLPFVASGTGGLEAAVTNALSPRDRVLALACGVFGDRFAAIAGAFGAEVIKTLTPDPAFTPFTPAIPVIYALHVSVAMILREGLPARFAHHGRLAEATREGVKALGCRRRGCPASGADSYRSGRAWRIIAANTYATR